MDAGKIFQAWGILVLMISIDYIITDSLGLIYTIISEIFYISYFIMTFDATSLISAFNLVRTSIFFIIIHYKIIMIIYSALQLNAYTFVAGSIFGGYLAYFPNMCYDVYCKINKLKRSKDMAENLMGSMMNFISTKKSSKKRFKHKQINIEDRMTVSTINKNLIDSDDELANKLNNDLIDSDDEDNIEDRMRVSTINNHLIDSDNEDNMNISTINNDLIDSDHENSNKANNDDISNKANNDNISNTLINSEITNKVASDNTKSNNNSDIINSNITAVNNDLVNPTSKVKHNIIIDTD